MEDQKNFLKKITELKLYIVEFEKNIIIKEKIYLFDYTLIHNLNCCLNIIIIYDEYIFFTNNSIQKA